jgi:hypothetical protein
MNEEKNASKAEFEIVFAKLGEPDAKATILAVEELSEDSSAAEEVARFARDSWAPFTTFLSR